MGGPSGGRSKIILPRKGVFSKVKPARAIQETTDARTLF